MPDTDKKWWYHAHDDLIHGPLSAADISSLYQDGELTDATPITSDRDLPLASWTRLHAEPSINTNPVQQHQPSSSAASAADPASPNTAAARERKRQSRKRARQAAAARKRDNTSVYVTGLPADAQADEVAEVFAKCGLILPDPATGRPRVKLYTNADGVPKGDALVTYALQPSVENAIELLDGAPLRPAGEPLAVQEASFDHKRPRTEGGPSEEKAAASSARPARDRKGVRTRDLVREVLTWADDAADDAGLTGAGSIVILQNVFDPANPETKYKQIHDDMVDGCAACGDVERVTVFERNAQGTVSVRFRSGEVGLACIRLMDGRWYDGRKLSAEFYDGRTDFRYKETEDDRNERDREWQNWLEKGGEAKDTSVQDDEANHQAASDVGPS